MMTLDKQGGQEMLKSKKGVAMLIVISLILMLLILGGAVLMISTGHFSTSWHQIKRARAYYAAEAAMQHVLWDLRTNGVTSGNYTSLPATFDVNEIDKSDLTIAISDLDQAGDPPGVHRIDITVEY